MPVDVFFLLLLSAVQYISISNSIFRVAAPIAALEIRR